MYKDGIYTKDSFWKWTAILFIILSIGAVLLALHCSRPLNCEYQYEKNGKNYCVSEIKI